MPVATLHFDADHPAFAGHFPGRPIVPGVLLLDGVQRVIEASSGRTLAGLAAAKFLSPVLPGEVLTVEFECVAAAAHFSIVCGTRRIANGRFLATPEAAA
jgi:3-hydroxyacyl-[acyl-carrier-protein] dehydratase